MQASYQIAGCFTIWSILLPLYGCALFLRTFRVIKHVLPAVRGLLLSIRPLQCIGSITSAGQETALRFHQNNTHTQLTGSIHPIEKHICCVVIFNCQRLLLLRDHPDPDLIQHRHTVNSCRDQSSSNSPECVARPPRWDISCTRTGRCYSQ